MAFVKSTTGNTTSSPTTTTAFTGSTTSHNWIVVTVSDDSGTTANGMAVTDSKSNVYTKILHQANASTLSMWVCGDITGGSSHTVTATWSESATGRVTVVAEEHDGGAVTLDKFASATGSSTTPSSGATATTTAASESVVGGVSYAGASTTTSLGSGYTNLGSVNVTDAGVGQESKTVASTGTQTATFGLAASRDWVCGVATFKAAGAATVDLAGTAPAAASATGAVGVTRALAGSASAASSATGSLSVTRPLEGDAAAASSASGSITRAQATEPVDVVVEVLPVSEGATSPDPVDVVVEVLPVSIGAIDNSPNQHITPAVVTVQPARFLAQSILTGQWLHWDLPVAEPEITWTLSGPTLISARFEPEILDLRDAGLEPWACWVHYESDGLIRASGILQPTSLDGEKLAVEAIGPSGYAAKVPFRGTYSGIQVDPADVVRMLWDHIQAQPRGDLGVIVNGTTPVRIGTPARDVSFETSGGEQVDFTAGPYVLNYWQNTLCGREVEDLAKEAPFDWIERCAWNADKTDVVHWIDLQYPRIGSRLFNLRFADGGENVLESAPIEEPDGVYASQVYVQGKGEGASAIAGYAGQDVGNRLRLPVVVEDKTIATVERANAVAAEQFAARQAALVQCPQIAVDIRHPNAKLGTFGPGDEIPLQLADLPWIEGFADWHRITAMTLKVDADVAVLDLTRQDQFSTR